MARAKDYKNKRSPVSPEEAASQTWSGSQMASDDREALRVGRRERIEEIETTSIQPDPSQPRRAVPSIIRSRWNGLSETATDMLGVWRYEAEMERVRSGYEKKVIEVRPILEGKYGEGFLDQVLRLETWDEDRPPGEDPSTGRGPLEYLYLRLVALAASIRREGLINPVTVVRDGQGAYRLETGERRWLAYHLLSIFFPEEDWSIIPARIVEKADVWRQATENAARDDLNAIGRARQFAILLMDLLGPDQFQPFDAFEREQDYYAQVADGGTWRVPPGKGELVAEAMGLKNPGQLRDYRALLRRLPNEAWTVADDYGITEYRLRYVLGMAESDEEIVELVWKAAEEFGKAPVSVESRVRQRKTAVSDPTGFKEFKHRGIQLDRYLSGKRKVSPAVLDNVLDEIGEMRRWLDEAEDTLRRQVE